MISATIRLLTISIAGYLSTVGAVFAAKEALLIANGEYSHFGKLPNPLPDAHGLAASLRQIGFQVELIENANREQMLDAIGAFEERLKASRGIAFFHYGGHGVQVNGRNYLIPADAEIPDEKRVSTRAVEVDEIMNALDASGAAANIVVLDACRDNPLPASTRSATRGLSVVQAKPKNSIIIYAAEAGNKAIDGLFTPVLAEAIKQPGKAISDVMTEVRRIVYEKSGGTQTPGEYSQLFEQLFISSGLQEILDRNPNALKADNISRKSIFSDKLVSLDGTAIISHSIDFDVSGQTMGKATLPAGREVKVLASKNEKILIQHPPFEPKWIDLNQVSNIKLAPYSISKHKSHDNASVQLDVKETKSLSPTTFTNSKSKALVLEGTQKSDILELGPGKHTLKGQYLVLEGQKLVLLPGAEIKAQRDSGISISGGSISIEGTAQNPVKFYAERSSPGFWAGLKFNKSVSVNISNATVESAQIGMAFADCNKSYVEKVLIARCMTGVLLQNRSVVHFEDCLITQNRENGFQDNRSTPTLYNCTISANLGKGYFCEYYGSPVFRNCIITSNKGGGIQGAIYDAFSEASNCIFENNGPFDVSHHGTRDWVYSACWWGKANTERLKSSNGAANLKSIRDQLDDPALARVLVNDFLEKPPQGIGSSLKID